MLGDNCALTRMFRKLTHMISVYAWTCFSWDYSVLIRRDDHEDAICYRRKFKSCMPWSTFTLAWFGGALDLECKISSFFKIKFDVSKFTIIVLSSVPSVPDWAFADWMKKDWFPHCRSSDQITPHSEMENSNLYVLLYVPNIIGKNCITCSLCPPPPSLLSSLCISTSIVSVFVSQQEGTSILINCNL